MLRGFTPDEIKTFTELERFTLENWVVPTEREGVMEGSNVHAGFADRLEPMPWFEPDRRAFEGDDDEWIAYARNQIRENAAARRISYGVADSVEQVLERLPWIEADEQPYLLSFVEITREDDPGWRWHKNGEYIGDQEPTAEYIGDEPEIEKVVVFSVEQHKA